MPEGDTVWRTAQRLHRALGGEVLRRCDLRWPGISDLDFTGARTLEVVSRGKHLLHRLETGWTVHSHLRMEGQWRLEATEPSRSTSAGRPAPPVAAALPAGRSAERGPQPARSTQLAWIETSAQVRAILATSHWTAVGLRLGLLEVVRTTDEATVVGHLGPDVLGLDWDAGRAAANLASVNTTIGAALLDQRNLAGVGTIWAAETLFLEKVNPWLSTTELSTTRATTLVVRAKRLLETNKLQAVQSSTGSRRRGETSYVHGRSGHPCRRCGHPVRVAMIGAPTRERAMFYCPTCQGGLAPSDDGRPQAPLGAR